MAESLFYANRAFSDCSSVDFLYLASDINLGKIHRQIRKRLLLGSLLTGVLSYIALGAHYGALVNSLGMSLLIGAFVYWLRREG